MVIYGWNSSHIKTNQPTSLTCPNCETKGSTLISVYSKHAHIFWIPLFPIGKTGASQCQHCNVTYDKAEMPEQVKDEYLQVKSEANTPIWKFAGLAIIGVLIVLGIISNKKEEANELKFIATPEVGDVYEYESNEDNFSTMKVIEVLEDSLYLIYNNYEIDKRSQVDEIDIEENYNDSLYYPISRNEIKSMYDDKIIFDVNR